MKKIYFAGSIRGGREDAALYAEIIKTIQKSAIVLTEHIGKADVEEKEKEAGLTDEAIYQQDTAWIRECDLLIAECTSPSLGVGYELAYAEAIGKPCRILYNASRARLSAMLAGDAYFEIFPYHNEEELFSMLETILR